MITSELESIMSKKDKSWILEYFYSTYSLPDKIYIIENFLTSSEVCEIIIRKLQEKDLSYLIFAPYVKDTSILKILKELDASYVGSKADYTFLIMNIKEETLFLQMIVKYQALLTDGIFKRLCSISETAKKPLIDKVNDDLKILIYLSFSESLRDEYMSGISKNIIVQCIKNYNEDIIIRGLPFIENDMCILRMVKRFKKDKNIYQALKFLKNDDLKVKLIPLIKSTTLKLKAIEENKIGDDNKFLIIQAETDSNKRRELVDKTYDIKCKEIYGSVVKCKREVYKTKDTLPLDLTFGIELECVGKRSRGIRLYSKKILGYDVKDEFTLFEGLEFASPKLSWNDKDLETIYNVCHFIHENELYTNSKCGGHIHFSSDYLDTYDAWFWFFYLYSRCERILYLISNRESVGPRACIMTHAKPISRKFTENLWRLLSVSDTQEFIKMMQEISEVKEEGVNLCNIFKKFNTVEIRIPNGEVNPREILLNILLFGNLIVLAKKLSRLPLKRELYTLIYSLDEKSKTDEEKLNILLKLIIKDEKIRNIFQKRYYTNLEVYNSSSLKGALEGEMKDFSFRKLGIKI